MNVSQEIAALNHIGAAKDFNGQRMAFAFGYCFDATANNAPEWLFEISKTGNLIAGRIDVYSATGVPPERFDVDEWESQTIHLEAPANRFQFREMKRAARAILNGRKVIFSDGSAVQIEALLK